MRSDAGGEAGGCEVRVCGRGQRREEGQSREGVEPLDRLEKETVLEPAGSGPETRSLLPDGRRLKML